MTNELAILNRSFKWVWWSLSNKIIKEKKEAKGGKVSVEGRETQVMQEIPPQRG